MENREPQAKPPEPELTGPGVLSESDVDRIARAITRGIKQSAPPPTGRKPTARIVLLVAFSLLLVAAGFGVWGFKDKPPQTASFRGALDVNSTLTVAATYSDLEQKVRETTVTGLQIRGHDKPVYLYLPMDAAQQAALASALAIEYRAGVPMEKDGPDLKLIFEEPTYVNMDVENSGYFSINRTSSENASAHIQISIKAATSDTAANNGPSTTVRVVPPSTAKTVQILAADKPLGVFSLRPGLSVSEARAVLKLRTYPLGAGLGEEIDLFFAGKEPAFQTLIRPSDTRPDRQPALQQSIEIKNSPGSVLWLGSSTRTMAAGESWKLSLRRPQEISLLANKITFDTSKEARVTSLENEAHLELLPSRFSLWPAWAQEAWRWGAITLTTGNLMTLLRFFKIFPS